MYSLWEKETKNQKEGRSIQEVTVKEDRENLQNQPSLLKKPRAKIKKTGDKFSGLFMI